MRSRLFAAILAVSLGTACGGSHVCPDADAYDLWALRPVELIGTWVVSTADGTTDGTMTFEGSTLVAVSGDTRLSGSWSTGEEQGDLTVELVFSHAHRPGIDEVWGTPSFVTLRLVAVGVDTVYALQSNGTYTRWTRTAAGEP